MDGKALDQFANVWVWEAPDYGTPEPNWRPALEYVPQLVGHLMYMTRLAHETRVIYQYKHRETRRYLNLEADGQAWHIEWATPGIMNMRMINIDRAIAYIKGEDHGQP